MKLIASCRTQGQSNEISKYMYVYIVRENSQGNGSFIGVHVEYERAISYRIVRRTC